MEVTRVRHNDEVWFLIDCDCGAEYEAYRNGKFLCRHITGGCACAGLDEGKLDKEYDRYAKD